MRGEEKEERGYESRRSESEGVGQESAGGGESRRRVSGGVVAVDPHLSVACIEVQQAVIKLY